MRYLVGRKTTLEYANQITKANLRSMANKATQLLQDSIDELSKDEDLQAYHLQLVLSNTQEELIDLFMRTRYGELLVDTMSILT